MDDYLFPSPLAAPLHDIGKIGIPDKVLLKPGKLNAAEWEIMQKHTPIGSDILSGSKSRLLKNAEIIALTHHDRWDGNGYPNGLKNIETHLIPQSHRYCRCLRYLNYGTSL